VTWKYAGRLASVHAPSFIAGNGEAFGRGLGRCNDGYWEGSKGSVILASVDRYVQSRRAFFLHQRVSQLIETLQCYWSLAYVFHISNEKDTFTM
jgi:hypothetical protein